MWKTNGETRSEHDLQIVDSLHVIEFTKFTSEGICPFILDEFEKNDLKSARNSGMMRIGFGE